MPENHLNPTDHVLCLTAPVTGMRKGKLQALQCLDVDRLAQVIQVRRSYCFDQVTNAKSQSSARAVPMSKESDLELANHGRSSAFDHGNQFVFANPSSANPCDASRILKRSRAAMSGPSPRNARFHDLKDTFGAQMADSGAPVKSIQE